MLIRRLFYSLPVFLLVSSLILAQTSPTESDSEKEKEKQEREKKATALIEQIAGEAALLKFSDNRALVLASVADLLWTRDEKRARQLFRQSADELVLTNNAPPEIGMNSIVGYFQSSSPRREILTTVAKYDPEFALELLYQTRPARIAAALASYSQPAAPNNKQPQQNPAAMMEQTQNRFLAENEIRLEQDFSSQAADKDPKLAAKLLRESLAKNGATTSVFGILRKINTKDNELAVKLLGEVAQKIASDSFGSSGSGIIINSNSNVATSFLREFYLNPLKSDAKSNEKQLILEDKTAREIANKLADALMKSESGPSLNNYFQLLSAMPVLEKIIPERAVALKQKQNALKSSMPQEMTFAGDFGSSDNSPEKMVGSASRMPAQVRGMMYRNAVDRAVADGKIDAVKASLNQAPEGKERDEALAYLDSKVAETKIKDGKFDEARKIIDALPSTKEKVERLVQMAISFQQKNTKEDKELASKLMFEARGLIDYTPEDEDAVGDYLRIAGGYAYIDPDTAFSMLDAFSSQANELTVAAALLAKYDKNNQNFQNGELVLTRGLPRIGTVALRYGKEVQLLANADIDRLRNIADKFQRDDARILLKLYIVQAFFTGKIGLQGARGYGGPNATTVVTVSG